MRVAGADGAAGSHLEVEGFRGRQALGRCGVREIVRCKLGFRLPVAGTTPACGGVGTGLRRTDCEGVVSVREAL